MKLEAEISHIHISINIFTRMNVESPNGISMHVIPFQVRLLFRIQLVEYMNLIG